MGYRDRVSGGEGLTTTHRKASKERDNNLFRHMARLYPSSNKGYLDRLVNHGKGQYSDGKGNHINGLEGFWGYLKRQLSSRGGIRKEKREFYLSEYVWRYNNRKATTDEKINKLIDLIKKFDRLN
ncbi:MAG TPA: transposase [bacterium]|nr:transposase [bacterium]HPP08056.1 transposase [bacterium]